MDIVIKSFNRPYYLDRCLFSIYKHVIGFNDRIYILDDGTPQKYLDRLKEKYPAIIIKKSNFYDKKVSFIEQGIQPKDYVIPTDLWSEIIDFVSDYFILIEDDIWFIDDLNSSELVVEMKSNNTQITKLFWLGNDELNQNIEVEKIQNIELLKPSLFTQNPFIYNLIFRKNYFEIHRRILAKLGIYTFNRHMAYYTIYGVAGTVLNKNFYSNLWKNSQNRVEETLQIWNALKFYKKNKNSTFAKYKHEILKTGFQSSATNQHKEHFDGNIDMFQFNKIINEAWFKDQFNSIIDLPVDINSNEIKNILNKEGSINSDLWISWVTSFKSQYNAIGCRID